MSFPTFKDLNEAKSEAIRRRVPLILLAAESHGAAVTLLDDAEVIGMCVAYIVVKGTPEFDQLAKASGNSQVPSATVFPPASRGIQRTLLTGEEQCTAENVGQAVSVAFELTSDEVKAVQSLAAEATKLLSAVPSENKKKAEAAAAAAAAAHHHHNARPSTADPAKKTTADAEKKDSAAAPATRPATSSGGRPQMRCRLSDGRDVRINARPCTTLKLARVELARALEPDTRFFFTLKGQHIPTSKESQLILEDIQNASTMCVHADIVSTPSTTSSAPSASSSMVASGSFSASHSASMASPINKEASTHDTTATVAPSSSSSSASASPSSHNKDNNATATATNTTTIHVRFQGLEGVEDANTATFDAATATAADIRKHVAGALGHDDFLLQFGYPPRRLTAEMDAQPLGADGLKMGANVAIRVDNRRHHQQQHMDPTEPHQNQQQKPQAGAPAIGGFFSSIVGGMFGGGAKPAAAAATDDQHPDEKGSKKKDDPPVDRRGVHTLFGGPRKEDDKDKKKEYYGGAGTTFIKRDEDE